MTAVVTCCKCSLCVLAIVGVLVALVLNEPPFVPSPRPYHLGTIQLTIPPWISSEEVPYGRYILPAQSLKFPKLPRYFGLKKWQYQSLQTPSYYIGFAFVDLGYAANAFINIVDKATHESFEYTSISPLGLALKTFPASSIDGCAKWVNGQARMQSCYQEDTKQYRVMMDVPVQSKSDSSNVVQLRLDATVNTIQSLVLLYPFAVPRFAYVHKEAGMRATCHTKFRGQELQENAVGVLDWTQSMAERVTIWKWASFATRVGDTIVGVNLSDDVYNDNRNISQENAIWLNGNVFSVGRVVFHIPDRPHYQTWKLRSDKFDFHNSHIRIELDFIPRGTREEHMHLEVIALDFVQPFGEFSGKISIRTDTESGEKWNDLVIQKAYGVVEDHYSKW